MGKEAPVALVADHDIAAMRPLCSDLRRRGARVLVADSIEKAVELAALFPPDLLVLDEELDSPGVPDPVDHFRSLLPAAEIALLSSQPSAMPRGCGLGLLYSGSKETGHAMLLDAILEAFPGLHSASTLSGLVLCVDDDRLCLASLARLLTRHGYRVKTFDDPRAALAAIRDLVPDLALVDVLMPGMSGLELTREIRREFARLIPVVLITGKPSEADRAAGRVYGADGYVARPCDPGRILDVVDYYAGDLDVRERELLESRG